MRDFPAFYTPFDVGMFGLILPLIIVLILATVVLKGFALWYAARAGQKYWFVALLVVNTAGILEVVYLLFFRPDAPYNKRAATPGGASSPAA